MRKTAITIASIIISLTSMPSMASNLDGAPDAAKRQQKPAAGLSKAAKKAQAAAEVDVLGALILEDNEQLQKLKTQDKPDLKTVADLEEEVRIAEMERVASLKIVQSNSSDSLSDSLDPNVNKNKADEKSNSNAPNSNNSAVAGDNKADETKLATTTAPSADANKNEPKNDGKDSGVAPAPAGTAPAQAGTAPAPAGTDDVKRSRLSEMVPHGHPFEDPSYLSQAGNVAINLFTLVWKGEKTRYANGTFPQLNYGLVLKLMAEQWFAKRKLEELTRKDFFYCLSPIEFSSDKYKGYFVPVKVSFGRLDVVTNDIKKYNRFLSDGRSDDQTIEDGSKEKFDCYLKFLKAASVKEDMSFFSPTFIEEKHIKNPYEFFTLMRKFLEKNSDNVPLYRDVLFCQRGKTLESMRKHTRSRLVYRLVAYNTDLGYAQHFSLLGYRVKGSIEGPLDQFASTFEGYEALDWPGTSVE